MLTAVRRVCETAAGMNGRRKPTAKNTKAGMMECATLLQQFLHSAQGCEHGNVLTTVMPSLANLCMYPPCLTSPSASAAIPPPLQAS